MSLAEKLQRNCLKGKISLTYHNLLSHVMLEGVFFLFFFVLFFAFLFLHISKSWLILQPCHCKSTYIVLVLNMTTDPAVL